MVFLSLTCFAQYVVGRIGAPSWIKGKGLIVGYADLEGKLGGLQRFKPVADHMFDGYYQSSGVWVVVIAIVNQRPMILTFNI